MRRSVVLLAFCAALLVALMPSSTPQQEPSLERTHAARPSRGFVRAVTLTNDSLPTTTTSTTTTTTRPVVRTTRPKQTTRTNRAAPPPPGRATASPAEASGPGRFLGTFKATCYQLRGTTASGKPAGPGSIAVDPRVIPLRTPLYVEGYGNGDARDTGGAIKGHRIDVWKPSCAGYPNPMVRVWAR